jgi:hypothetical protein
MPNTRYGLSARPSMRTRYGLTTSAAPVMSSRKRYGLTTENRQIVSTLYPFKTERYSIRYAKDITDTAQANRREREFMAVLVAPDPFIRRWNEQEIELVALQDAARSHISEVDVLANDDAKRTIMQPVEENPLETAHLLERTFEANQQDIAEGVRMTENEAVLLDGVHGIRNVTKRVDEAVLFEMERAERTYESFLEDSIHLAYRKLVETDAVLIELEAGASPFKLVYEHQIEAATVKIRERESLEIKSYTVERLTALEDVIEHELSSMTHRHEPVDVVQSESVVSKAATEKMTDAELQTLEPARLIERIFDITDAELPDSAKREQEEIVSMASADTAERNRISEVIHQPFETAELIERIRDIAPMESLEVAKKDTIHHVAFAADIPGFRQRKEHIIELASSDTASKQERTALVDLVPLDVGRRLERELEVYLQELGSANSRVYLVYESQLEPAARRRPIIDMERMEDVQAARNTTLMHPVEFSPLDPFDRADKPTVIEYAALEQSARNVTSDVEMNQDEAANLFREAKEVAEHSMTEARQDRLFESIESTFDTSTKDKVIESELVEHTESERIKPATLVQLEQTERSIRSQVEIVTSEPLVIAERTTGINVLLQAFDEFTRTKEAEAVLAEGDTMERQAKEAVLIEGDAAERKPVIDTIEIPLEFAERNPVVLVEESTITHATRTMTYIELIEGDEAIRTMKPVSFIDGDLGNRKKIVDAYLEELEDVDELIKKKKRIWLIQARANHWNALSHWKKTR